MRKPEILDIRQTERDLTISRERPVTKAERQRNPNAKVMTETISVHFSLQTPKITVNRNICE
jgi:hypothetical protein